MKKLSDILLVWFFTAVVMFGVMYLHTPNKYVKEYHEDFDKSYRLGGGVIHKGSIASMDLKKWYPVKKENDQK